MNDASGLREALAAGRVRVLDKPVGATPLACLEALRKREKGSLDAITLGFAGRLDPLASGVLLALVGDENRAAERYRALDKRYDAEVLVGAQTDSLDVLGLVEQVASCDLQAIAPRLEPAARALVGTFEQPLPAFAAHRIKGRSLWSYARARETPPGPWPTYVRRVDAVKLTHTRLLSRDEVLEGALARVATVTRGDFRQPEVRARWSAALKRLGPSDTFACVALTVHCSSGTFVRALAQSLGESLGSVALLWSLRRTHVGVFTLDDAS